MNLDERIAKAENCPTCNQTIPPADDDEPATVEWAIESLGWERLQNESSKTSSAIYYLCDDRALHIQLMSSGWLSVDCCCECQWVNVVEDGATRGQVRRLIAALKGE